MGTTAMRGVIIGVVLLGAGLAIGWLAGPARQPAAPEPVQAASVEIVAPSAELERLRSERNRLEAENEDLVAQVTSLLDQQAEWLSAAGIESESATDAALTTPGEENGPRRPDWNSEEMRARREEFMQENERRMQEFRERLAAQLDDPAAVERFNALMEWQDYQRELMGEMRRAETEEERDAIRAKMEEARQTSRKMVQDQQDAMLRDLAKANGVSDPKQQAEFVSSMKRTFDNPFFSMEGMLSGGGPPGRGGFPFGGGRRGGRDAGQFRSPAQN